MVDRPVKVRLSADVDEYVTAMKKARKATRKARHALDRLRAVVITIRVERSV